VPLLRCVAAQLRCPDGRAVSPPSSVSDAKTLLAQRQRIHAATGLATGPRPCALGLATVAGLAGVTLGWRSAGQACPVAGARAGPTLRLRDAALAPPAPGLRPGLAGVASGGRCAG